MRLIVISGHSGAGKSTARNTLEDLGYFTVDTLPPALWPDLVSELAEHSFEQVAVVFDIRGAAFIDQLEPVLNGLKTSGVALELIFLEASPDVLLGRYNLTRRLHPLGLGHLTSEFQAERRALAPVRALADLIIDTSTFKPQALAERLRAHLGEAAPFTLRLVSFGFKWGIPQDADLVLDVRTLPNPYYDPKLKLLTGTDPEVSAYVFGGQDGGQGPEAYYEALLSTGNLVAEATAAQGRAAYTIAVGCTGGRHRSVATIERLADDLRHKFRVEKDHRDVAKED